MKIQVILSALLVLPFTLIFGNPNCNYTPWFAGTLLEFSSGNQAPNTMNVQPYFYAGPFYGFYDESWKLQSKPSFNRLQYYVLFQYGITKHFQMNFSIQEFTTQFKGKSSSHIGDTQLTCAFQLLFEKKNTPIPNLRFLITETFPTGRYELLDPFFKGLDASGLGTYQTQLGLVVKKNFYFIECHPFNINFNFAYNFNGKTNVRGTNTYGGGNSETRGRVKSPDLILVAIASEFCLTQNWVLALDLQYHYITKSVFKGTPGSQHGIPIIIGSNGLTSEFFNIAPAIEYNFSSVLGMLVGGTFTIAGRNAPATAQGVLTVTYSF